MNYLKYIIPFLFLSIAFPTIAQQPFRAGNIVVYRIGDGTSVLNSSVSQVFLDEYTTSGVLVQSVALPVTGQKLTLSGELLDAGLLNLSTDGKYLVVPGWDMSPGTSLSTITGNNRSIALVDFNGAVKSVTVITNNPNTVPINSAISDNGTNLWLTGGGAVESLPAVSSTSTLITAVASSFNLNSTRGQLFASTNINASPIIQVGTGLPTTAGQTTSTLPGLPLRTRPRQFAFADLDQAIAGPDVLYLASQNPLSPGGIQKYSLVNSTWVANGQVGTTAESYTGLTIKVSGNTVTIFATRQGNNTALIKGGELISLTDNSGYNATLSGTPVVIASVATPDTKALRGVALVPQPAPFTGGNIVVYRVGDGTSGINAGGTKIFLDEYTTAGALVQSILMPTTGQKLTMSGSYSMGGMLSLSADGSNLIVPGFNLDLGAATVPPLERSVGVVDYNGQLNSITTVTDNPENFPIISATSDNGTNIWFTGSRAVEHKISGSPGASTKVLDFGSAGFFTAYSTISDGQLYIGQYGASTNKIGKAGNGLPVTSGQSFAELPGIAGDIGPLQFAFADIEPALQGADVLYVASQASTGGGIQKYSLVNGSWMSNGVIGTAAERYSGLTIKASAGVVTVFATRRGGNSASVRGGQLVRLTDNSGYNGTLTGTPDIIASVTPANTKAFRGLALVPQGCITVRNLQALNITSSQATLSWNAPLTSGGNYEYAITTSSTPPSSGTATTATSATVAGLSNGITYYAHVRTVCSALSQSEWSTVFFVTSCKAPSAPQLIITVNATGAVNLKWDQVFGAANYEYLISTSQTAPATGTATTDTSVNITGLNPITSYYVHIRSDCGAGAFSSWTTKPFTTRCFMPVVDLTVLSNKAGATWNKINYAVRYEYALTPTSAKPLSGVATTDTFYLSNDLKDGSNHYLHVRSICSNGAMSEWNTVPFSIKGLFVYPNPVKETLHINLNGMNNAGGEIMIADATGRLVHRLNITGSNLTIDTRPWATGIYMIWYKDGRNTYTVRIFKQ